MQTLIKIFKIVGLSLLLLSFGCTGNNKNNTATENSEGNNDETANQQPDTNTLIFGLNNSVLFKETLFDDINNPQAYQHQEVYTPKYIKANLKPELLIRFVSQMGIAITPTIKGSNVYSSPLCNFDSYLIDEKMYVTDLTKNCFLQIGEHDFDNDERAEIIIAFGVRGARPEASRFFFVWA